LNIKQLTAEQNTSMQSFLLHHKHNLANEKPIIRKHKTEHHSYYIKYNTPAQGYNLPISIKFPIISAFL